jgi:Ca2+-binding EF-hand superfamily protein
MKRYVFISAICVLVFCNPLFTQDTKKIAKAAHDAYKSLLKETDKNNDGKISRKEYFAIWKDPKIAEKKYVAWDVNKDGYITEEEYVKVVMNMGKKK